MADDRKIVNLDEHRIRVEREFEDDSVAYIEALWGKETFAWNAAIRDLEGMRRGEDDGSLRPPALLRLYGQPFPRATR